MSSSEAPLTSNSDTPAIEESSFEAVAWSMCPKVDFLNLISIIELLLLCIYEELFELDDPETLAPAPLRDEFLREER